jgi:hypothetical protein
MFFSASTGRNRADLFYAQLTADGWTFPEIPDFSKGHVDYLPYIMPDGKKMIFGRIVKDVNGKKISGGVYVIKKMENPPFSWQEPRLFPQAEGWMHVSATADLTIYTTYLPIRKTARFKFMDGGYPVKEIPQGGLHPGGHPSVSPDERYIVFDSDRDGGFGEADLYVCFRRQDGSWGKAVNLGARINSPGGESIPHITLDGKYLFFSAKRDIYWVNTSFIENLESSSIR